MISRQQLEIINRRTLKYPLSIAEKDYFLASTLQLIAKSELAKILVFKGGTAIHHCYLDQHRFSEDLDFSCMQNKINLSNVKKIFNSVNYLKIKKDFLSDATIKIEKLQYTGPLIQPNSLKIEVDYLQNVLLPPQNLPYKNVWGLEFCLHVMDVKEIAAEKIRAMSDRARYRDFYDLFLILEKYQLNLNEIIEYIKMKEIRRPISKKNIQDNWKVIASQKQTEMSQIYYSRIIEDEEIDKMVDRLPLIESNKIST